MIRAYHPQDLATVLSIWLQGNLDAHPFVPVDYWRKNYALTAQLLPQAEVYVAEVHGQVVGFLGLMEELVAGVFVDRAHRGAGLGSALLRQAQERRDRLRLFVYQQNPSALRLYQRHQFAITKAEIEPETGAWAYQMEWKRR